MSTNPASWSEAIAGAPAVSIRRWRWPLGIAAVAALMLMAAVAMRPGSGRPDDTATPVATVQRGPLTISVVQSGTIRSSQAVTIRNEVAGRTTVLRLIEEGTQVKAGDLLIELDSSKLRDSKIDQEIAVQGSQAVFVQARENLEVTRKQAQADIKAAEVARDLAVIDLRKYLEGEHKQALEESQTKITIAEAELKRASDKLEWSQKLAKEGYITSTELQADQLTHQKAQLELQLAKGELDLLEKFTYQRTIAELQSGVDQKAFALEKSKHKAASSVVEAESTLRAKQLIYEREQEKLAKLIEQIAKCRIVAPVDGMAVYATSSGGGGRGSSDPPLAEGSEVREMQEMIRLPTTAQMLADVKIHESILERVRVGLPVKLKVESLRDRVFSGTVSKIAVLPDGQSFWTNPDLKVFNTEITLHGDTRDMRPGMTCSAEIIIAQLPDAMYVPLQAVLRVAGEPTVYVPGSGGVPEPRKVKLGLDNNRMVEVVSGLTAGEKVLLAPPLPPSTIRQAGADAAQPLPVETPAAAIPPAQPHDSAAESNPRGTGGEASPGNRPRRPRAPRPENQAPVANQP